MRNQYGKRQGQKKMTRKEWWEREAKKKENRIKAFTHIESDIALNSGFSMDMHSLQSGFSWKSIEIEFVRFVRRRAKSNKRNPLEKKNTHKLTMATGLSKIVFDHETSFLHHFFFSLLLSLLHGQHCTNCSSSKIIRYKKPLCSTME